MKSKKLKKSLSIIFLSKIYLNSSIFIIKEEDNDSSLSLESYTFLKVLSSGVTNSLVTLPPNEPSLTLG